jgi:hypothetical protein
MNLPRTMSIYEFIAILFACFILFMVWDSLFNRPACSCPEKSSPERTVEIREFFNSKPFWED